MVQVALEVKLVQLKWALAVMVAQEVMGVTAHPVQTEPADTL